jgi:hypothetical protein
MNDVSPISTLAGLRIAIGVLSWLFPNLAGRLFGLNPKANPQSPYLARLFGVRDVALGAGALASNGSGRRLWVRLGIACDLADAAAAWLGDRDSTLPRYASVMTGGAAVAAAGMGVAALFGDSS